MAEHPAAGSGRLEAGGGIADQRQAEAGEAQVAGGDDLEHGRHAGQVGAESCQHAHFGGSLVARPEEAGVDPLRELESLFAGESVGQRREAGVVGGRHVGEARPPFRRQLATQGVEPGQVEVIADQREVAGPASRPQGAAGVGQDQRARPELGGEAHREDGLMGVVALVGMEAPAQVDDAAVGERLEQRDLVLMPLDRVSGEGQEIRQVDGPAFRLAEGNPQSGARDQRHLGPRPAQSVPALHRGLDGLGKLPRLVAAVVHGGMLTAEPPGAQGPEEPVPRARP